MYFSETSADLCQNKHDVHVKLPSKYFSLCQQVSAALSILKATDFHGEWCLQQRSLIDQSAEIKRLLNAQTLLGHLHLASEAEWTLWSRMKKDVRAKMLQALYLPCLGHVLTSVATTSLKRLAQEWICQHPTMENSNVHKISPVSSQRT